MRFHLDMVNLARINEMDPNQQQNSKHSWTAMTPQFRKRSTIIFSWIIWMRKYKAYVWTVYSCWFIESEMDDAYNGIEIKGILMHQTKIHVIRWWWTSNDIRSIVNIDTKNEIVMNEALMLTMKDTLSNHKMINQMTDWGIHYCVIFLK